MKTYYLKRNEKHATPSYAFTGYQITFDETQILYKQEVLYDDAALPGTSTIQLWQGDPNQLIKWACFYILISGYHGNEIKAKMNLENIVYPHIKEWQVADNTGSTYDIYRGYGELHWTFLKAVEIIMDIYDIVEITAPVLTKKDLLYSTNMI